MNKKITEFQKQKCDKCDNKDTDLCEIHTRRIDGNDNTTNMKENKKKFNKNITLVNETIQQRRTNSIGFCFLSIDDYTPEKALHFLSGIANFDVCVVFETTKELNKTYGEYANPIKRTGDMRIDLFNLIMGFTDKFTATEYCTTEYNNQTIKVIKYSENIWQQWQPSEEQSNLEWIEVKKNDIK